MTEAKTQGNKAWRSQTSRLKSKMKIYIAKDGDRLDTITYNHYGHLRFFEQILTINPKLNTTLHAGDKVFLPDIKEAAKEQAKLW